MKLVLVSFFLALVILNISCSESYDFSQASLGLGLKDFSCTEAWIEVQIGSNDKTADIYIKKDDEIIRTVKVAESKTLFYFDDLLPNTAYKFDAVTYEDGKEVRSNPVTFTTLDTTSHNFTWQTFEFGQHSSSTLYDVAIIDENNIWAAGEIYMNDSYGNPDPKLYNAVHWDGSNWNLKRFEFYTFCPEGTGSGIYPAKSVFCFPTGKVVISSGSQLLYLNDSIEIEKECVPVSVNKIWGFTPDNFYIVGRNGKIAYNEVSSWISVVSGTTTNINDVWGIINQQNNTIIYCAVSSFFVEGDKKILKIIDGKVDSVNWGQDIRLYSAWTNNENFVYVCGEGVYVNKFGTWTEINLPLGGKNSIRGIDINDIFIDGDNGFIAHYNGSTWQTYSNNYLKGYSRLDFKGNTVAVAGNNQGKAIIEIGKRN